MGNLRSAAVALVVAGVAFVACLPRRPSAERVNCLQVCAQGKDACILKATTADGIQQCDAESRDCSGGCPVP